MYLRRISSIVAPSRARATKMLFSSFSLLGLRMQCILLLFGTLFRKLGILVNSYATSCSKCNIEMLADVISNATF